eukprot:366220-Chlamydomonas_euryale.AAC.3
MLAKLQVTKTLPAELAGARQLRRRAEAEPSRVRLAEAEPSRVVIPHTHTLPDRGVGSGRLELDF